MKPGMQMNTWVFVNNCKDSGIIIINSAPFPSFVAFRTHSSNFYKHRLTVNWIVPIIIGGVDADFMDFYLLLGFPRSRA